MKLFVIYIGGSHEKSFIELHDMRFVIAETLEDTFKELRKSWWGIPKSLHIDAWGCLTYADGMNISIRTAPPSEPTNHLFFINLGGYDKNEFTELHKNVFIVAENESRAKVKALKTVLNWESPHKDYQFEVEQIICIDHISANENAYIHLEPNPTSTSFEFVCKRIKVGAGNT